MSSHVGAIQGVNALIGKVFQQPKGDFADRLNSRVTVCLLALSSVLLLSVHFMGDPITCWTPAQFTKQWSDFVNQYCYVHGTYFVPLDEQLSFEDEDRRKVPIHYYQWVPYIFALQAFLFYLPRFIWRTLIAYSGYDLAEAIKYVDIFWNGCKANDASFKARVAAFEGRPSVYIWDGLRLARKKRSREMVLYYVISSAIQTLNAFAQFFILNSLLGSPIYTFWGPSLLTDLVTGEDWQTTGHFPRIVHCDFNRRRPASVQMDTVLCVLTLNLIYEKIFLFLWFWLLFVSIVSFVNTCKWLASLCSTHRTRTLIANYLATSPMASQISNEKFLRILGRDGLFVIEQISLNLGDIPASYLAISMRNIASNWDEGNEDEDEIEDKRKLVA